MGNLSNKLSMLRHRNNYSLNEVAQKLKISEKKLLLWESGRAIPTTKEIEKLAAFYHVRVKYLLINSDNKKDVVGALLKFLVFIVIVAIGINVWVLRFMIRDYKHMAPGPAITLALLILTFIVLMILLKNNKKSKDRR